MLVIQVYYNRFPTKNGILTFYSSSTGKYNFGYATMKGVSLYITSFISAMPVIFMLYKHKINAYFSDSQKQTSRGKWYA